MKRANKNTPFKLRTPGDRRANANAEIIFLRMPQVIAMCGISRSSIYEAIKNRTFPGPVKVSGSTCSLWLKHEIAQWMHDCVHMYRKQSCDDVVGRQNNQE